MHVGVRAVRGVGDDEEGGLLKQHHLVGAADLAEALQLVLQRLDVGDELVDDAGPGLVERLVPDGGLEERHLEGESAGRVALNQRAPLLEDRLAVLLRHQVHLVDQHEELRVGRVLVDGLPGCLWGVGLSDRVG